MDKKYIHLTTLDNDLYENVIILHNIKDNVLVDYPYAFQLSLNYDEDVESYRSSWNTYIVIWLHNIEPFENNLWINPRNCYFFFKSKELALQFKLAWS
jgi:hypothetical protein